MEQQLSYFGIPLEDAQYISVNELSQEMQKINGIENMQNSRLEFTFDENGCLLIQHCQRITFETIDLIKNKLNDTKRNR